MEDDYDLPEEEVAEEELEEYEEDLEGELEEEDEETEEAPDLFVESIEEESGIRIVESDLELQTSLNVEDANHRVIFIVRDEDRITSNIIQWSEAVEAIGIRASQIESGSSIFTDVDGLDDPIEMAKKEFYDRQSPLILERPLNPERSVVEQWKVREMDFPRNIYARESHAITNKQIKLARSAVQKNK